MTKTLADYFKGVDFEQVSPSLRARYQELIPLYDTYQEERKRYREYLAKLDHTNRVVEGLKRMKMKNQNIDISDALHDRVIEGLEQIKALRSHFPRVETYALSLRKVNDAFTLLCERGQRNTEDLKFFLCLLAFKPYGDGN